MRNNHRAAGFTLVEVTVSMVIIGLLAVSIFGLFVSLVNSTVVAKKKAVANTLAINQMEYIKSLPYDSLIVQSGTPLTENKTVNGRTYTVTTGIRYVDDAYDGCANYPSLEQKKLYCRNYPPPTGAPSPDTNPGDYKGVTIRVTDAAGKSLASIDTHISARVAETASTTGALFVTVLDPSGQGVGGATVNVTNTTLTPNINKSDVTDANGKAIFYGLPPDNGADYVIAVSKTGYSSLVTIDDAGALAATYAKQRILAQQPSEVGLSIAPMDDKSLVLEATDLAGAPLSDMKVFIKGGYKKYTSETDYSYYYNNISPTDNRPTTDASGVAAVTGLPPINSYIFCGDAGATSCSKAGTTYYLAAVMPYTGSGSLGPLSIPVYTSGTPRPYEYDGVEYLQKVRLVFTTNAALPRILDITPDLVNLSDNLNNTDFTVTGANLSDASIRLVQGGTTYLPKNCNGTPKSVLCRFDLTAAAPGTLEITVQNAAGSITLPFTPRGGVNVQP